MFLFLYVVSRVVVTDPDVDVSSRYVVSGVCVTEPDVDVSSRYVVSRVGVTDPDVDVCFPLCCFITPHLIIHITQHPDYTHLNFSFLF